MEIGRMNGEHIVKVTYHLNENCDENIHMYIPSTLENYHDLHKTIAEHFMREHKKDLRPLKIYWIDNDGDQISLSSETEFKLFKTLPKERFYFHAWQDEPTDKQTDSVKN